LEKIEISHLPGGINSGRKRHPNPLRIKNILFKSIEIFQGTVSEIQQPENS